jgi:hypothetical protein
MPFGDERATRSYPGVGPVKLERYGAAVLALCVETAAEAVLGAAAQVAVDQREAGLRSMRKPAESRP